MADEALSIGDIFGRLGEILRENAGLAAGSVVGLTAINVALDQISTGSGTALPAGIASLAAQYYLTASALERRGLREPDGRNRFGAFWWLNLVSALGIALGYILLIVPGLYLMVRWSTASAVLLAEGEGVSEALGGSGAIAARSFWPILGALLVIFVPAGVIGIGLAVAFETSLPVVAPMISYVFLFSAFGVSWLAAVSIYSLARPGQEHLAEVFA
jgi:hypothetical protein